MGGAQKVFLNLVIGFMEAGHDVIVALPKGPLVEIIAKKIRKVYIININSPFSVFKILNIIHNNRVDLINAHLTKCALIFSISNIFPNIPLCSSLHNDIIHEKLGFIKKRIYPTIYFVIGKLSDGIIAVSEYSKNVFINRAKISPDNIRVIYNGIKIPDQKIGNQMLYKKRNYLVGAVGRLSIEKGYTHLIEALGHIDQYEFNCVIVGDGPCRKALERQIKARHLSDKVKILGFMSNVYEIIREMDVIVVPSLNETFGISIVEAFFQKKPVIASNAGGIPELVKNNVTGYLFKAGDVQALVCNINYVLKNLGKIEEIIENAYNFALMNFTSEIMTKRTSDYFEDIIKHSKREHKP